MPPVFSFAWGRKKGRTMPKANQELVPAVGYLRKSTAGEAATGRERQEKSIPQQKREIEQLAKTHGYKLIRWYADPGKSGWKRGTARPDFTKMLADANEKGDFLAIICDDVDRFSRAEMELRCNRTRLL